MPFIDTNVILDVLLERQPHHGAAVSLFNLGVDGEVVLATSSMSIANIYYVASKVLSAKAARTAIVRLRGVLKVLSVDQADVDWAVVSDFADFEDALQYSSAARGGCDCLVTRNAIDFAGSRLPVHTPDEFLALHDAR